MELFPAVCFPSIGYIQHLVKAEMPVIDLGEHFEKQSFRNRFEVLGPNGRIAITVRVHRPSGEKIPMSEVKVVDDEWRRLARKGIQAAYGKSAFYMHFADEIEAIIMESTYLSEVCLKSTEMLLDAWGISSPEVSKEYVDGPVKNDHRSGKAKLPLLWEDSYPQVFSDRFPFVSNLSGLDLLMNLGPEGHGYLTGG